MPNSNFGSNGRMTRYAKKAAGLRGGNPRIELEYPLPILYGMLSHRRKLHLAQNTLEKCGGYLPATDLRAPSCVLEQSVVNIWRLKAESICDKKYHSSQEQHRA